MRIEASGLTKEFGGRQEPVAVAPHQQRRRRDPPQLGGVIEGGQAIGGIAPHPGRQLAALGHQPLQERLGQGEVGGAGLELADKAGRHRVGQGPHGRLQPRRHLGGQRPSRGGAQDQPGDPGGVGHRHPPGGKAAPRVPDQGDALDGDGVQEGHGVGGEVLDPVAAGRALGVAVATLVQGGGGKPERWAGVPHGWPPMP